MRVLLASDHFPPFIGGAHRWAALLASGLARRGHEVTVATVWHGGLPRVQRHAEEDVVVHRVRQLRTAVPALVRDPRQRHAPPFPDPITIRDLRRVIKGAQPDVVLAHGWLSFSVVPALGRTGIPLIASIHDYGSFCATTNLLHDGKPCTGPAPAKCLACAGGYYGKPKGWTAVAGVAFSRPLLAHRIAGLQSVASFVDEVTARYLLGSRAHDGRVRRFTVPAFVAVDPPGSTADNREVESILAKLPKEPFILFVGALRPLKGIEVLFDAYRRLADPPPLVLMGTIERDTPQPFPPGVIVLTENPHAAVMAAWDRAMLGVAPSVWPEPLGTVSIEAITRGCPMIATAPSGMADVLGEGAGILVPQADAAALAEAMRSLIEDPARREALSRTARARSASFQAEPVLSLYEQMLGELATNRRL